MWPSTCSGTAPSQSSELANEFSPGSLPRECHSLEDIEIYRIKDWDIPAVVDNLQLDPVSEYNLKALKRGFLRNPIPPNIRNHRYICKPCTVLKLLKSGPEHGTLNVPINESL